MQQAVKKCPTCCKSPHEVLGQFRAVGSRHDHEQDRVEGVRNENTLLFKSKIFPDMSTLRFQMLSEDTPTAVANLDFIVAYGIQNLSAHDNSRPKRAIW